MEHRCFDDVSRQLASGSSRRSAIKALAGGALATVLVHLGIADTEAAGCRKKGRPCGRDRQCCSYNCKRNDTCGNCGKEGVCAAFKSCGPAASGCECYITTGGFQACVAAGAQCDLPACRTSADCAAGSQCVATCCANNICAPLCVA